MNIGDFLGLGGGLPNSQQLLTGVGMPGGPGGMGGPMIPPELMNQIRPSASPDQAVGGNIQDPRIQMMIRALMSGTPINQYR